MKITYSVMIKAPIETVFAFLEEEDEKPHWNPTIESVTNPDGYDPKHPVGTKFVQGIRDEAVVRHVIGKVTAYDKPHHLSMRMTHYDYVVNLTFRLARHGTSTKLDFESDMTTPNLLLRPFLPMQQYFNKRSIVKQLQMLRVAAEKT